ncbi:Uncharacterised protein [Mycobacteroides abscessus subsp. abscessus]|nr:Uncharacterised protein [Mycobacteroides abscessus subsp. abscessus]
MAQRPRRQTGEPDQVTDLEPLVVHPMPQPQVVGSVEGIWRVRISSLNHLAESLGVRCWVW